MSLYEAAGGAPAMLALATDFHARCLADPQLEHPFSHQGNPEHVQRLADYWGEVFGGPPVYSESYGGHSGMLGIHANQGAEAELGDRFVACFVAALDGAHLPADPELRAALSGYIRWATDEVMTYSPAGARVPAALATPRWDFDGLRR
ncbi:group II truncated hemoglobin [Actinoplanes sp. CA-051413]|uniref:group II truncated hemoglobin n=1 Tax=Actinoplanes sp. CA-051413 TaxID=3239899 RepID=UPI003D95A889